MAATPDVRTGQGDVKLSREEFERRLRERFYDPLFDAAPVEIGRIVDWLTDMELVPAAAAATLDRYIGYYEPYATSHAALDRDTDLHEEVRNAARVLVESIRLARAGQLPRPDRAIRSPRPK